MPKKKILCCTQKDDKVRFFCSVLHNNSVQVKKVKIFKENYLHNFVFLSFSILEGIAVTKLLLLPISNCVK